MKKLSVRLMKEIIGILIAAIGLVLIELNISGVIEIVADVIGLLLLKVYFQLFKSFSQNEKT